MDVRQIAPGLWRWTGWHEEWKEAVGCVYLETREAVVLIDPIVPPEDRDRFLHALERDLDRAGQPLHVLVTVFWHTRSARELAERYDARVWAPRRARAPIARRAGDVHEVFRPGDTLPGGVEALPTGRATEVIFWIPEHRTLVPGDVLLGDGEGGLRLCPRSWLPRSVDLACLRDVMRPLLRLPVERVLVSHGDPVLTGGRDALERALAGGPGAR